VNLDGSSPTSLNVGKASSPRWSPDGQKIVFSVHGNGISVVNADGSGLKQLTSAEGDAIPLWLPDGRIAFHSAAGNKYMVMDVNGNIVSAIGDDTYAELKKEWSPGKLAYVMSEGDPGTGYDVRLITPDSSFVVIIMDGKSLNSPTWCP
jgi:Tol biopolymer transport system component